MDILPVLLCVAVLISTGANAQQLPVTEDPSSEPEKKCRTSDFEDLKFDVYSKLEDTEKEVDSLRTDLQHWQNTTLYLLKKYLVERENNAENSLSCDASAIAENLIKLSDQPLGTAVNENCCTNETVSQMRELMEEYKRAQSDELREIISEMGSDRLPLGTFLNPAPSCKDVNAPSGKHWIQNAGTGYASLKYCDMNRRCCDSTGGWMRVAFLDMTNPNHHCPAGFRSISSPLRMCGRPGSGCYSTTYSVDGVAYSRVCGRVKAYHYYASEAFYPYYKNRALTIDDVYVDGVSLTHGTSPRKHIWTFAAALDETRSQEWVCPCTRTSTRYTGVVPPFIGQDYFCDTGSRYRYQTQWYTADPLWDGEGCGATSSCCEFNNPPWFCKELPQTTTDDIELRVCGDQATSNEEFGIEQVEIFVQ